MSRLVSFSLIIAISLVLIGATGEVAAAGGKTGRHMANPTVRVQVFGVRRHLLWLSALPGRAWHLSTAMRSTSRAISDVNWSKAPRSKAGAKAFRQVRSATVRRPQPAPP
jgi:hypothetical protein